MKKLVLGLALFSSAVMASDSDVINSLDKLGYKKSDVTISDSPVKGLKSASTPDGTLYLSDDGKYLTQGPIFDLTGAQPENIANSSNVKLIKTIAKDAIVYKAKNEKYIISVFTDYTCHYCQQFHENIQTYLDAGISVHYFAFPRSGPDSDVGKNMQSIWSAADRKVAFDNAYKANAITPATSMVPYVKEQFNVGRKMGINGTPAIFLANGQMIAGYIPADKLLPILEKSKSK